MDLGVLRKYCNVFRQWWHSGRPVQRRLSRYISKSARDYIMCVLMQDYITDHRTYAYTVCIIIISWMYVCIEIEDIERYLSAI